MSKSRITWASLEELRARREAIMQRLVRAIAAARGFNPEQGLPPQVQSHLEHEAANAADDYFLHALADKIEPKTVIEKLLAELYEVDGHIFDLTEGGRGPNDSLH